MGEKMQEREMPKSILKLRDHLKQTEPQDEIETVLTQESVKSVTFDKSVDERQRFSQRTFDRSSELEETREIQQEKSISRRKYKNAETLVRAETKQVVQTRVNEQIRLNYVNEGNIISEQKIATLNKNISKYTDLSEKLKQNLQTEKHKQNVIKNKVKNIGDGVFILREHFEKMLGSFRETQSRADKILNRVVIRKKEIIDSIETLKSKTIAFRKILNSDHGIKRASSVEDLRQKNITLKNKFKEIRKLKNSLAKELNDISKSREIATTTHQQLKEKKEDILKTVSSIRINLETLKINLKAKEEENLTLQQEFKKLKEVSEEGIRLALEKKLTIENYLQTLREDIQSKVDSISVLEQTVLKIQEEIGELNEQYEKMKSKFQGTEEDCQIRVKCIKEKLDDAAKKIEETMAKKNKSQEELKCLRNKYLKLCEERNKNVIIKIRQECCLRQAEQDLNQQKLTNEALREKYEICKSTNEKLSKNEKILEEQIEDKEELLRKLSKSAEERLNANKKAIEDLEKKQEYLKSSQVYLVDKFDNLRKEIEALEEENKKLSEQIENEKGPRKIEDLTKELTKEREKYATFLEEQIMPPGILKSPKKTPTTSPKKVTFHGVPSSEDSSRADTQEDTFDDFIRRLEMVAASRPKPSATKRRRID